MAVIVYWALYRTAPRYLSDQLSHIADMPFQSQLQLLASNQLTVRLSRLVTIVDQLFASAGTKLWNSHLDDIMSASSFFMSKKVDEFSFHMV